MSDLYTKIKLINGQEIELTYCHNLIMIQSDFISAQWEPNATPISLEMYGNNHIKIGFYTKELQNYQSWYVDTKEEKVINDFFTRLGYKPIEYITTN
ncbi:hypothetical protein [Photobacterium leiognathi]|uniref:hypothetical protein n=1 Tax=Photobacterium leiognathi TaxID=553611 RepID=UPI00298193E7|nr:hypothetical protein [Photobacterium leiognathi]